MRWNAHKLGWLLAASLAVLGSCDSETPTDAISVTPPDSLVLSQTRIDSGYVRLTWSPAPAGGKVEIERTDWGNPQDFDSLTTIPARIGRYDDRTLSTGAVYYYRVTFIGSGEEVRSDVITVDRHPPAIDSRNYCYPTDSILGCFNLEVFWHETVDYTHSRIAFVNKTDRDTTSLAFPAGGGRLWVPPWNELSWRNGPEYLLVVSLTDTAGNTADTEIPLDIRCDHLPYTPEYGDDHSGRDAVQDVFVLPEEGLVLLLTPSEVLRFDTTNERFLPPFALPQFTLSSMWGRLAYDAVRGNIWVTNEEDGKLVAFEKSTGTIVNQLDAVADGRGINKVFALGFTKNGIGIVSVKGYGFESVQEIRYVDGTPQVRFRREFEPWQEDLYEIFQTGGDPDASDCLFIARTGISHLSIYRYDDLADSLVYQYDESGFFHRGIESPFAPEMLGRFNQTLNLIGCDGSLTQIPTSTTDYPSPKTCFALGESGETLILMVVRNRPHLMDKTGQIAEPILNLRGQCVAVAALDGRLMLFADDGLFITDLAELVATSQHRLGVGQVPGEARFSHVGTRAIRP